MSWIKLRVNLTTHPKVVTLASRLGVTKAHAIGALACAWFVADQHADHDGRLGMSADALDQMVELPGFSTAMESIGWLVVLSDALQVPDYQAHNGTTGKSRASAQKRAQASRSRNARVTAGRDESAPEQSRAEQRREEENLVGGGSPLQSGLDGLDGLAPLDALHHLGINGPNAQKLADAGLTTAVIRTEAEAIHADPSVKQPARALAARLMDRAGIGRRRKGGNTTPLGDDSKRLADAIARKRGTA